MTSFSNLLSSLGNKPQAPQAASSNANASKPNTTSQPDPKPANGVTGERFRLTPQNSAAGVKRRSEEPAESLSRNKSIKTEQNGSSLPNRPAAGSRFQLSAKPSSSAGASAASQRSSTTANSAAVRPLSKQISRPGAAATATPTPPSTADASAKPKRGFASILEKAKAAEAAAKATNGGGIRHKPVEKLSKKERVRLKEEARAQQKAGKKGQLLSERSRSGTPVGPAGAAGKIPVVKGQETSYKGTMNKSKPAPAQLAYKGTMKAAGSVPKPPPKKGMAQDKYGGYASWSDLDAEEEDQDEGGYDDSDDDMEAGIDDLEAEESAALRAARKEDQEALAEEERLKREKLERKKRLMQLSKSAAARKKF